MDDKCAYKRGGKTFERKRGRRGKAAIPDDSAAVVMQDRECGLEPHEPETPVSKADPTSYDLAPSIKGADALQQIQTAFQQLPLPSAAARNFPSTLTPEQAEEIGDWFYAFSNSLKEGDAQFEIEVNPEAKSISGNEGATASLPGARRPELAEGRDLRQDVVYE